MPIKLYGSLARKIKKQYPNIDPKNIPCKVRSAGEAVRAMESQFPGFKAMIRRKGYYKVVRGQDLMDETKSINEKEINMRFAEDTWHIMPVAAGAGKGGGLLNIILGAILVVTGVVMLYFPATQGFAPSVIMAGAGMMLGGIVQMLTPVPELPKSSREDTPSYLFNGALNVNQPGHTIPVAYGETFIGSIVASFGVKVEAYT